MDRVFLLQSSPCSFRYRALKSDYNRGNRFEMVQVQENDAFQVLQGLFIHI